MIYSAKVAFIAEVVEQGTGKSYTEQLYSSRLYWPQHRGVELKKKCGTPEQNLVCFAWILKLWYVQTYNKSIVMH